MVPELIRVRLPLPILPAPWMVDWLVSVPPPKIKFSVLFPIVRVPAPLSVVFPPILNSVALPVLDNKMLPALLMLPPLLIERTWSFEMFRLSVLKPRVRLFVASLALIVTAEFVVLMQVLVLPVGTPDGLQLPARSQLPVAPPAHVAVHCAKADSGQKISASSAISRMRLAILSLPEGFFTAKDDSCMRLAPEFVI